MRTTSMSRKSIIPFIGSMNFSQSTDKCEIPDSAIPASAFQNGFVLFGWVNPRSIGATAGRIFDKSTGTSSDNGIYLRMSANNSITLNVNGGTTQTSANNSVLFNRNSHFISQLSANATVTHYINGVPSGTPGTTGALSGITTTNPLTIGNRSGTNDRAFDGSMAQVGILSLAGRGALTQEEVNALYLHNVIPQGTKILHLETTAHSIVGDQWLDKSGNNNHATIEGATFSYDAPTKRIAQIGAPKFLRGQFDGTVSGGVTIADGAMVFDGVDGEVIANKPTLGVNNTHTIVAWCNPAKSQTGAVVGRITGSTGGARQPSLSQNGGTLRYRLRNEASVDLTLNFTVPSFLTTYCLIGEYNSATGDAKFYVDNTLIQEGNITGLLAIGTNGITLGSQGGGSYWEGFLNSFIFNRTLTPDERTAIFNAGPNAKCPITRGLVAQWSGRDYVGTPAAPTKIFDVASWSGLNVQD